MKYQRHIGKLKNTDARIIVVFMQLPEDPTNALVVDVDSLPPKYQDILNHVLMTEGQQEPEISKLFNRRGYPDGRSILRTLHDEGLLMKVPTHNISMLITHSEAMDLDTILSEMNKLSNLPETLKTNLVPEPSTLTSTPASPWADKNPNEVAASLLETTEQETAQSKLLRADVLEQEMVKMQNEALSLRDDAYTLVPDLKPKRRGRPPQPPKEK